jgi:hypothetical protein
MKTLVALLLVSLVSLNAKAVDSIPCSIRLDRVVRSNFPDPMSGVIVFHSVDVFVEHLGNTEINQKFLQGTAATAQDGSQALGGIKLPLDGKSVELFVSVNAEGKVIKANILSAEARPKLLAQCVL